MSKSEFFRFEPEFLDRIEAIEQATGLVIKSYSCDNENGESFVLGTGKPFLDVIFAELQYIFTGNTLVSVKIDQYKATFDFDKALLPSVIKEAELEIAESNSEFRIKQKSPFVVEFSVPEERFFEDWDILQTGGGCKLYEKRLGPFRIWISNEDGSDCPKRGEAYRLCLHHFSEPEVCLCNEVCI